MSQSTPSSLNKSGSLINYNPQNTAQVEVTSSPGQVLGFVEVVNPEDSRVTISSSTVSPKKIAGAEFFKPKDAEHDNHRDDPKISQASSWKMIQGIFRKEKSREIIKREIELVFEKHPHIYVNKEFVPELFVDIFIELIGESGQENSCLRSDSLLSGKKTIFIDAMTANIDFCEKLSQASRDVIDVRVKIKPSENYFSASHIPFVADELSNYHVIDQSGNLREINLKFNAGDTEKLTDSIKHSPMLEKLGLVKHRQGGRGPVNLGEIIKNLPETIAEITVEDRNVPSRQCSQYDNTDSVRDLISRFSGLKRLKINLPAISGEVLNMVGNLNELHSLSFLGILRKCLGNSTRELPPEKPVVCAIEKLEINSTSIPYIGDFLEMPNLKEIEVAWGTINKEHIDWLSKCQLLKKLTFIDCKISKDIFDQLRSNVEVSELCVLNSIVDCSDLIEPDLNAEKTPDALTIYLDPLSSENALKLDSEKVVSVRTATRDGVDLKILVYKEVNKLYTMENLGSINVVYRCGASLEKIDKINAINERRAEEKLPPVIIQHYDNNEQLIELH
ncbi:hypothetical protein QS306_09670 [Paraburkholderia bonniea]|uniref:hypothetical protein n=1 Tax=Paraburkholderia bonniea TaxID=2152891 RepID=UPI00129297EB|nr:hypothetical protein [Paraburkholderia bonniea]WJF89387.1 hypothetical protein QS306_09670 [Paraburkholderia bonniea]WJF92702.1 hypothetical protein QS308_09680 [Paraburkholderia bonniea]